MTVASREVLLRRGRRLEPATLGWNVVGIAVLAVVTVSARPVALAGFGLDRLIETGASTVVLCELANAPEERQRRALHLIGRAFVALVVYLSVQSTIVLAVGHHAYHSTFGIAWTAVPAAAMFSLAAGKACTGAVRDGRRLSRFRSTGAFAVWSCCIQPAIRFLPWTRKL